MIAGYVGFFEAQKNKTALDTPAETPNLMETRVLKAQTVHRPAIGSEPGPFHNGTVIYLQQIPPQVDYQYLLCHENVQVKKLIVVVACAMSDHWTITGPVYDISSKAVYVKDFLVNMTTLEGVIQRFNISAKYTDGTLHKPGKDFNTCF